MLNSHLENDDMLLHDRRGHHQSVRGGHPTDVIDDHDALHRSLQQAEYDDK